MSNAGPGSRVGLDAGLFGRQPSNRMRQTISWLLAVVTLGATLVAACGKNNPVAVDASPPVALVDASPPPPTVVTWNPADKTAALTAGRSVMEKNECTRCHIIDDLAASPKPYGCTSCHLWLKSLHPGDKTYDTLVEKWGEPIVARYQKNIFHLQRVPELTDIGKRMRGDYIVTFLTEPFDQRPMLEESMFRHNLAPNDIKAIARYFAAKADAPDPLAPDYKPELPPKPDAERLARGKELFKSRACATCHTLGNVDFGINKDTLIAARSVSLLAPNLRFARERTRPDSILTWIMAPQTLLKDTTMPALVTSREDAEVLRDYIYYADAELKPTPPTYVPQPVKILDRTVPYSEMKERVLGKVCVHCHMNDYEKDAGVGNKGGFGYHGIGLQMRTYETLVQGAVGLDGKRYSVLVPKPGEKEAPIITVMMKRRIEEQRDHVEAFADYERPHYSKDRPGMPMGLPAMDDESMSLLATWIAQGCQGPTDVAGKPGVNDGYLVPDGPITHNKGCELRGPEKVRPKWAVDQK